MLRVEKITYEIKGRKLLKDISFQLRKGEVLALLGANGAGKSSLMHLLSRDTLPTEGQISLMGKFLQDYSPLELAKKRAMLAQQNNMSIAFKVREIVQMGRYPHYRSVPSQHDHEIVDEVMEACGITPMADRSYLSLSGGEQQRVQLARVLVQIWDNPDSLLLLDEPVSALDLQFQQQVLALAKALSRKGFMVVVVLHDINLAALYSDRILMLKNGRKWCEGTPIEIMERKNIYTVFSVHSEVSIDTKTLQPVVKLEELVLDASQFNTKLPKETQEDGLIDKHIKSYKSDPFYRINKEEMEIACSDMELLKMAYPRQACLLGRDIEALFSELPQLGSVTTIAYSTIGYMEFKGRYSQAIKERDRQTWLIACDKYRMALDLSGWKTAFAVCNEWGQSFQFFDQRGTLLHKIVLSEEASHADVYEKLCSRYKAGLKETVPKIAHIPPSPAQLSAGAPLETYAWKRILGQSFSQGIVTSFTINHAYGTYTYGGIITGLVDQGERYQVMYKDCIITLDRVKAMNIRAGGEENTSEASMHIPCTEKEPVDMRFEGGEKPLVGILM